MTRSGSKISSVPNLNKKRILFFLFILVLFFTAVIASLAFGSRQFLMDDLLDGLFSVEIQSYGASVIRERIPRTVFSLMCGAALGVSGALMQAITLNPIADPSILGVNNGAALFVVMGLAFMNITTAIQYIILAILGALLTAALVYGLGSMGKSGTTPIKLVLSGAATSAALSSIVSALILSRSYVMDQFRFWQVGSVGSASWINIKLFAPFLVVGLIIGILSGPALNSMALGDEVAKSQGVSINRLRALAAFTGVVLCGSTTALAGPIGFIGLMAPHAIRLMMGNDFRYIIPLSAVMGAVLLTFSDVLGRIMGGMGEIEAGIITAFIGAPILILLTLRMRVRSL